jgi:hypothetical protein
MDVSSSRLDHEPRTAQYFPGFGVRMPFIASSLLFLVDRVRAEQREPEIRYALQQALQLRLVADETNQRGFSLLARKRHAFEGLSGGFAELSVDGEAVLPCLHTQTVAAAAKGCRLERDDHICDSVSRERRARSSQAPRLVLEQVGGVAPHPTLCPTMGRP